MSQHIRTLVMAGLFLTAGLSLHAQENPPDEPPATPAPDAASEESAAPVEKGRPFHVLLEVAGWDAHPFGPSFVPVYTENSATSGSSLEAQRVQALGNQQWRYRLAMLPKDSAWGGFEATYWTQDQTDEFNRYTPGQFIYREALPVDYLAGYADDGMADGFTASLRQSVRDTRFVYTRSGIEGPRLDVDWHLGVRFVDYTRTESGTYYASLPTDFPPLIVPTDQPGLYPTPDTATQKSAFSGRGLELGVEGRLEVMKNLHFQAGLSVCALRGSTTANYASGNAYYYTFDDAGEIVLLTLDDIAEYLQTVPSGTGIIQGVNQVALHDRSSTSALAWDAFVEARWRFWRSLEAFVGGRFLRYEDVATTLRPQVGVGYTASRESVGYEGVYLGLAFEY